MATTQSDLDTMENYDLINGEIVNQFARGLKIPYLYPFSQYTPWGVLVLI